VDKVTKRVTTNPKIKVDGIEETHDALKSKDAKADKEKMTCIECHFGIAHKEPDGITPQELKAAKLEKKK